MYRTQGTAWPGGTGLGLGIDSNSHSASPVTSYVISGHLFNPPEI